MNDKILFLFIIILFISSNHSIPQTFEVKGGVGIYNVYDNKILIGRPREVKFNSSPFVSFLLDWKLGDDINLGWENRIRIKSGNIDFIGLDTITNTLATRFEEKFLYYYFDSKVTISYSLNYNKDFTICPILNAGISIKFLDDSPKSIIDYSRLHDVIEIPPDGTMPPENISESSGIIIGPGIKIVYKNIVFGIITDIELFETFLYDVGEPSYLYTTLFVGYRF